MKYLLGIDIGTQGTKASLFDSGGKMVGEAFEPSNLITRGEGHVEQNPDEIYASVVNTIREVLRGVNVLDVAAVGIDGQMAGIMGIDEDWCATTPYDSWLDTRCGKYIEMMKAAAEEEIIKITGCPATYAHGAKMLWWKHEEPGIYEKTVKFIVLSAYVVGRLAGLEAKDAYIDDTQLHFSGFGDIEKKEWSVELVKAFDIDACKLPRIVCPWEVVGSISNATAEECGLRAGTPVVAGCGDQTATALSAGIVEEGLAFDGAGTASVFSCGVSGYAPDVVNKTVLYARSCIDGLWIPLAYINGGGLCLKWFAEKVAGADLADLDREAQGVGAGSGDLIFVPHFAGKTNYPGVKGSWIGLGFHHDRAHLHRAIMESIAYEYRTYKNILNAPFDHVRVIGGGAKSRIFNQIKADVLGVNYISLKRGGGTTYGSAILAGLGAGLYSDLVSKAKEGVEVREEFVPNPRNHERYRQYAEKYEHYLDMMKGSLS